MPATFSITTRARRGAWPIVGALVLSLASMRLSAQYQVNPMVNRQVNTAKYTHYSGAINFAGTPGGIHAKSSQMMNSEFKYAAWKSGATRSDIRMGYAALGPRSPTGPESYINYSPSYLQKPAQSSSPPPAQGGAAFGAGSIKYSSASSASSSSALMSRPMNTSMTPSLKPTAPTMSKGLSAPGSSSSMSSIHYSK